MKKLVVAIDGPAGAGKSTVAQLAAKELGYTYIDTGAMYRAVAWKGLQQGGEVTDEKILAVISDIDVDLSYENGKTTVRVDGQDVTGEIRTPEVSHIVSQVAALGPVREKMVDLQRKMAERGGVLMDGRDIATNVLPGADVKIYLTASIAERANRRYKELREKGLAQAAKKAGRIAAEGAVVAYMTPCGCTGALVEVNCETDFVANTDNFKNFANAVAKHVALANPADLDELMKQKFVDDESKTIEDMVSDATVAIGEKITVRRFARYETEGVVSSYIHMGGKVGVMVEVATDEVGKNSDLVKEFAHDVCLQIAAAKPEAVRREEVDADKLAKEAEIQRAKAIESGKPEKIVDRIVAGQIEKYYKEVCLLDQQFVKTITSLMNETAKAAGTTLDIVRYVRFERGEGIEKRKDDLAAEIAAMKKA